MAEKTYSGKTLKELFHIYETLDSNVSQIQFCKSWDVPKSTFNDYVRKMKQNMRQNNPFDMLTEFGKEGQSSLEREFSLSYERRYHAMRDFLDCPCDIQRTEQKMAGVSSRFFAKCAVEFIAKNGDKGDIVRMEKLFYPFNDRDIFVNLIKTIKFIYSQFSYSQNNVQLSWYISPEDKAKTLDSAFLYLTDKKYFMTSALFNYIEEIYLLAKHIVFNGSLRLPNTLEKCHQILRDFAHVLEMDSKITSESLDDISEINHVYTTEAYAVISEAETNMNVFGKAFPYDFRD